MLDCAWYDLKNIIHNYEKIIKYFTPNEPIRLLLASWGAAS